MARVLERGDIFFVYRPKLDTFEVRGLDDVQRLFVILHPRHRDVYRRLVIGRKRMPEPAAHERFWAVVDRVAARPQAVTAELHEQHYRTRTRGVRDQPAARPAGEGVYAIVDHGDHRHLAYRLELPHPVGEVQHELHVQPEASYVVAAKASDGRFVTLDEPSVLDREGTEIVLIGASADVASELGIELDIEHETLWTAEMFTDLALDRAEHPIAPLVAGEWA